MKSLSKKLLCALCCGALTFSAVSAPQSAMAASKNISFPGVNTALSERPDFPGSDAVTRNDDGTYTTDLSKLGNRYVHDAEIIYGKGKDGKSHYFCFSTDIGDARIDAGIPIRISDDLVNWTCIGQVFNREENNYPADFSQLNYDRSNSYITGFNYTSLGASSNIWAPCVYDDTEKSGYYYLYYSCSNYGGRNSNIAVAKSRYLDSGWEDCGILITSRASDSEGYNAIDPSVLTDANGRLYMIYGSWFYGINCVELDTSNPAALKNPDDKGTRIAARYSQKNNLGGYGVEGPTVIYNAETGYYYLFSSYDFLFYSYNVRVGRSENITGPYVDSNGNPLIYDETSPNGKSEGYVGGQDLHGILNYGNKVVGGYSFNHDRYGGWQGTAHNAIFQGEDGNFYLTHNSRPTTTPNVTYMNLRKVIFNDDGWPMVSPEQYAGETAKDSETVVKADLTDGSGNAQDWEFITLHRTNNPEDFSNAVGTFHVETSTTYRLKQDGTILSVQTSPDSTVKTEGAPCGRWSFSGKNSLTIDLGDENGTISGVVMYAWDYENWKESIVFTGITEDGVSIWGKKGISKAETPVLSVAASSANSITLTPIENAEYSIDHGAHWQSGNQFDGLSPDTSYQFVARIRALSVYPSDISAPLTVTTPSETKEPDVTPAPVVTLKQSSLTIKGFNTAKLSIQSKSPASDQIKKYTSSKPAIVSVTNTGKLTAKKVGTAVITLTMQSGATAKCKVTVKKLDATKITLNKSKLTLKKGRTAVLTAKLKPAGATSTVKWSSSHKKIVSVKNGKVTARKKGSAVITAKAGAKTAKCKIKVK